MHKSSSWSLSLGRWGGLRLRLHASFLWTAVFTLYVAIQAGSGQAGGGQLLWVGGLGIALLFVIAMLHELGHCYAAARIGGPVDELIIAPLGGILRTSMPHDPRRELITLLAGPMVNVILAILLAPFVFVIVRTPLLDLLNPVAPAFFVPDGLGDLTTQAIVLTALKLAFWINWVVLLVNLLPAFPFDGGRVLRCVLWPTLGYRTAVIWVARMAKFTAGVFCLLAWLSWELYPTHVVPAWVPLVLMAITIFFSTDQEVAHLEHRELDDELFGYDFSEDQPYSDDDLDDYLSDDLDDEFDDDFDEVSLIERWREKRHENRLQHKREQEEAEEARVDEILERLHNGGIDALLIEERALLNRVSARYRRRLRNQA